MIRHIVMVLTASLSLASPQLFAQGHAHHDADHKPQPFNPNLSSELVMELAAKVLPKLVSSKKVGSAWAGAQPNSVGGYANGGKVIWLVNYKNPDGKVDGGKKLHLIFDDLGNFVGSNHTGELEAQKAK